MDRTWRNGPGVPTPVITAGVPSGRIQILRSHLRAFVSTLPVILLLVSP